MLSAVGGSGKQEKRSFSAVRQRFICFITKYSRRTILFLEEQCECGCFTALLLNVLSRHCSFSSMAEISSIFSKGAHRCLYQGVDLLSTALRHTLALAVKLEVLNLTLMLHVQI